MNAAFEDRRVALVTGAARGIGLAIADRLQADGMRVARLDRGFDDDVAADRFHCDIAALDTHAALLARLAAQYGRIDCLINNAGIASPRRGDFLELAPETFDAVMDVNLRGTVFFTQAAIKAMLSLEAAGRRSVTFITSSSSVAATPERLDYCMSKASLTMLAKGLAVRLALHAIDVYEVRPGIIRTDMTARVAAKYDKAIADGLVPEGRWGEPHDVAAVCAALARGDMPYCTGAAIDVGGGLMIPRY